MCRMCGCESPDIHDSQTACIEALRRENRMLKELLSMTLVDLADRHDADEEGAPAPSHDSLHVWPPVPGGGFVSSCLAGGR